MTFQLEVGPHPFPDGTHLFPRGRPWWGVAVVESHEGQFCLRWPVGLLWRWSDAGWQVLDCVEVHR